MNSYRISSAFLMLVSVSHVARSECFLKEKPDCDSRPWSSWSQSCDYPCNALGTQTRRRLNEECYENCEPAEEKRPCSGTLPADCELSSWSAWSSCNFVDDLCAFSFAQRSTRYKSRKEGCGGTCSAVDYERSRQAACSNGGIPFPNYTCQCKENFYGACCEHEEDKGVEEPSWNKDWLGFLSLILLLFGFISYRYYQKKKNNNNNNNNNSVAPAPEGFVPRSFLVN